MAFFLCITEMMSECYHSVISLDEDQGDAGL